MNHKKKNTSFTLIELLVVIVIVGVLAGVIMVATTSSINNATLARAKAFSSNVQNSMLLNLVSEWTFDDPSNIGDDSCGTNDGILVGPAGDQNLPQLQSEENCVFRTCLKFDGYDDYVTANTPPNILDTTTELTISVWVNLETSSTDYQCINSDNWTKWYIGFAPNGKTLYGDVRNTSGSGIGGVNYVLSSYGEWYYIVETINQEKGFHVYLNGERVMGRDTTFLIRQASGTIQIGSDGTSLESDHLKGLIDDVRIYNAALSSSQIKQNYIAGLNSMLTNGNISKEEYNQRIELLGSK